MEHLRIFLPVFFLLYFLFAFLMSSTKQRKSPDKLQKIVHVNNLVWVLAFLVVVGFSLYPNLYHQYFIPFEPIKTHTLSWVAIGIMSVAFFIILLAQNQRRISHSQPKQYGLVLLTQGVYSISRNPLSIGQIITFIGLFLSIPSVVTLIVLVAGMITIFVRVQYEERAFEEAFGQ
ncbi:MAG: methyltransferase [Cyclobacteriaceae bacterium]